MTKGIRYARSAVGASIVCLALTPLSARAQRADVTLVLSDSHTEPAASAIRGIYEELPTLRQRVRIRLFPSAGAQIDLAALRESRVIVFNVHPTELVEAMRSLLEARIADGAVVYAVGGTPLEGELRRAGLRFDRTVHEYYEQGGPANLRNLILDLLHRELALDVVVDPPESMPEHGILHASTGRVFDDFDAYRAAYAEYRPGRPWVGVTLLRTHVVSGQTRHVEALVRALEARDLNVLPIFGHPEPPNLERYFFDAAGVPRVGAVVAMSLRLGVDPDALGPVLERLDAPVINAIVLSRQSAVEWRDDPTGLDITERAWQVASPELGGLIAPTVVASKEAAADPGLGLEVLEYQPIDEGVARVADRAAALVRLRTTPPADKRLALVYYNYPPGRENVGASYLNVLPGSLVAILSALDSAGYDLGGRSYEPDSVFDRVIEHGRNAGPWTGGELERLVTRGQPVMIPVSRYREWFDDLPEAFRQNVVAHWGEPEDGDIMTWRSIDGETLLVLPAVRWGNILLAAQPLRAAPPNASRADGSTGAHAGAHGGSGHGAASGHAASGQGASSGHGAAAGHPASDSGQAHGESHVASYAAAMQDPTQAYHDLELPPHHQYIAFYLWLRHEWDAHAVVHVGTHGTHEWLPGKEVGLDDDDSPEVLLGALPNVYLYIVDDVGEGLQAKRRGMATIVDHLTPPFDSAGLESGLADIMAMIDDYNVAIEKSATLADVRLGEINAALAERGLLTDLGMDSVRNADEMRHVEHHLRSIGNTNVPYGMHVFGRSPTPELVRSTAEAMASLDPAASDSARASRPREYIERLAESGPREREALLNALAGRYVHAGPGNDPLRNPASVPTGKNFYAFNPSRIPSAAVFAKGAALADTLVRDYRERHGRWPERLTYNLWSTETLRHEGIVESQVLWLLGMRPVYDPRGAVTGVEPASRKELNRPRVDVTLITSGLYRDIFPNLIRLIDSAVTLAAAQEEADNFVRIKTLAAKHRLVEDGIPEDLAARLAALRVFGVARGAYGANLGDVIEASDTWEDERQVANMFLGRMSHAYGQGFWGERPEDADPRLQQNDAISVELLEGALAGTRIAVHSRSSNVYATLDNDDFYQFLGGTAMAIRAVDGTDAEVYVSDLTNPSAGRQETLARFMGRELRARYLNPKWIEGMMQEGYAGARFMSRIVAHLWGWQVTVPDVVDGAKWNEVYATYVEDRNELGLDEWFGQTEHAWAYQTIVARLLETTRKGYWEAPPQVVAHLAAELARSIAAADAACNALVCNNAELLDYAMANLEPAPATALATAIAEARGEAPTALAAAPDAAVETAEPDAATSSREPEPLAQPARPDAEASGNGPAPAEPAPSDRAVDDVVRGYQLAERSPTPNVTSGRALLLLRIAFIAIALAVLTGWIGSRGVSQRQPLRDSASSFHQT